MDDFTVHLDVRINKEGDQHVSHVKERIWRPLVSYHTHVLKDTALPGFLWDGLGLTFITNSAIIVEGVIADIIDEYCVNTGESSIIWRGKNLDDMAWHYKKEMYNHLFPQKSLESYKRYDAIDILFKFRNNVAHGLAHIEKSSTQQGTHETSSTISNNRKYQDIREFFIRRNFIQPGEVPKNTNYLWKFQHASYLWMEAKYFIEDILQENESSYNAGIQSEWKTATTGRG